MRITASILKRGAHPRSATPQDCKGITVKAFPFPTTVFSSFFRKIASSCLTDILWQQSAQASPTQHIEAYFNFQTYSCEDPGCPV